MSIKTTVEWIDATKEKPDYDRAVLVAYDDGIGVYVAQTKDCIIVGETRMCTAINGYPEVADHEEMMANARLIAETTTILEMLIEAVEHIDKNTAGDNPFAGRLEALLNRISGEETK